MTGRPEAGEPVESVEPAAAVDEDAALDPSERPEDVAPDEASADEVHPDDGSSGDGSSGDGSSGDGSPDNGSSERAASATARWRRRAEVFGDVLPEATRDDLDEAGGSSRPDEDARTRWIRQQVPPHHL